MLLFYHLPHLCLPQCTGAQEVFKLLPHKMVSPAELAEIVRSKGIHIQERIHPRAKLFIDKDRYTVYGTVVTSEDIVAHNDSSKKFSKADYYSHPENYHSVFVEKVSNYYYIPINIVL